MDIEKARDAMQRILDQHYAKSSTYHLAEQALRALDDDGEEWKVGTHNPSEIVAGKDWIGVARDEATARRIAALPRLERAAKRLIDDMNKSRGLDIELLFARDALVAALKQED